MLFADAATNGSVVTVGRVVVVVVAEVWVVTVVRVDVVVTGINDVQVV